MKKSPARSRIKSHKSLPHFHPFLSVITLVLGVLGTLFVTHVLAQTANNTIYACAQKQTGNLRMVSTGTNCRPDETAITWNIQGPQGIPGPAGSGGGTLVCPGCRFMYDLPNRAGKDLSDSELNDAQFATDLTQTNFTNAYLSGTGFSSGGPSPRALLNNTNFHNVVSNSLLIYNIHGDSTNFSGIHGISGPTVFTFSTHNITLTHANFQSAVAILQFGIGFSGSDPDFSGSDFTNTNLSSQSNPSDFSNVNLSNANFTGANLRYTTNMGTATLTGAIWSNTTCPDGTNSNNNGNTCVGHL